MCACAIGSLVNLIASTALYGLLILLPFSNGFAILRSRLWDIDLIINRTLVYGTLTAILDLAYVGLVSQTSDRCEALYHAKSRWRFL